MAFNKENRDQIVVIGDGVDPVGLALSLRKKVGHADLVNVEELVEQAKKKKTEVITIYTHTHACELHLHEVFIFMHDRVSDHR